MKSELLTTAYAPLKRSRQNSLPTIMTTTSKIESKMPNAEMSLSRQVSLAAAFHDHISCTKTPDLCRSVLKEEKAHMPCETDHIYANCSSSSDNVNKPCSVDEPQQRLKDMLLLQLDLIQHQQEQLSKRDRQLQTLRQEKEALKVRLERMERRMVLLKQRKERVSTKERSEAAQSTLQCPVSPTRNEVKDSKALLKPASKRPYISSSTPSESNSTVRNDVWSTPIVPDISLEHPWSTTVILPKAETTPQKASSSTRAPQKSKSKLKVEGMQTRILYPLPLCYFEPEPEIVKLEPHIEVPTWRYNPITSGYQLEGTENLDDDIFLRRHHKLEIDEKRRKRWDIQRIREQRHNEKLRRGRALKGSHRHGDEEELGSFFPLPRDVQFVEVSDTVPVVAFGYHVPHIPSSDFSLDWFTASKRVQKEEHSPSRKHNRSVIKKES